jgi:hypothetical protein
MEKNLTRYRFTVEFDLTDPADGGPYLDDLGYNANPGKWHWPDLIELDDDFTTVDWSTWNVEEVK